MEIVSRRRARLLFSLVAAGMIFSLASWTVEAAEAERVRIAYASRSNSATPQYLAQSKGFFKAEGLEVELIQMNPIMMKWLPQTAEVAPHSYDLELKTLARDGQMTDGEIETLIDRLAEKERPLDEVRDFF